MKQNKSWIQSMNATPHQAATAARQAKQSTINFLFIHQFKREELMRWMKKVCWLCGEGEWRQRRQLHLFILFLFGWAARGQLLPFKEDEQPTQPNQLLAPCSAAIGGCWLIKERVGELPFFLWLLWVIGRRPISRGKKENQSISTIDFFSLSLGNELHLKRMNKID